MAQYVIKTKLGNFLAGFRDGRLVELALPKTWKTSKRPPALAGQEGAAGRKLLGELREYLAGRRTRFTVPMAPEGTAWQRRVWQAMRSIPWGQTRTYGEIARAVGAPGAARAVGAACGANPVLIINPCHRVVASNGLGGFGRKARRLDLKKMLLGLERA